MAAPTKPWERMAGINTLNRDIPPSSLNNFPGTSSPQDQLLNTDVGGGLAGGSGPRVGQVPPPLPPRPNAEVSQFGYSGTGMGMGMSSMYSNSSPYSSMYSNSSPYSSMYSSPYSSMYQSSYSPLGGYGGYGGYGGGGMGLSGYNRYGYSNPGSDNRFTQLAEENSRQAFQSIGSVVQAVGSVSMMLESTFCAVYNSFRAVIGVADQFAMVKAQMGQIFSFFALFRGLRWLYRRILYLLGIIPEDFESELWDSAQRSTDTKVNQNKNRWPVFLFLAMVFGTPWVIWKILALSMPQQADANLWAKGLVDHHVAIALYDFNAGSNREIYFKAGQEIRIAPKESQPNVRGWIMGSADGGATIGLMPTNYIQLLGMKNAVVEDTQKAKNDQLESLFDESC